MAVFTWSDEGASSITSGTPLRAVWTTPEGAFSEWVYSLARVTDPCGPGRNCTLCPLAWSWAICVRCTWSAPKELTISRASASCTPSASSGASAGKESRRNPVATAGVMSGESGGPWLTFWLSPARGDP
jgi:hypothetical protein